MAHWHGHDLMDEWAWLRDPGFPEVRDPNIIEHIDRENAEYAKAMDLHRALIDDLADEIAHRTDKCQVTLPYLYGDWLYWTERPSSTNSRKWLRSPATAQRPESGAASHILDEAEFTKDDLHGRVAVFSPSPDGMWVAIGVDRFGDDFFDIIVKNLKDGTCEPNYIVNCTSEIVWSMDSSYIFYVSGDTSFRGNRVMSHAVGNGSNEESTILEEDDPAFHVSISESASGEWLIMNSEGHLGNEVHLLPRAHPLGAPRLACERQSGSFYRISDNGSQLICLVTDDSGQSRVLAADSDGRSIPTELVPPQDCSDAQQLSCFADFLILERLEEGHPVIDIWTYNGCRLPRPQQPYQRGYIRLDRKQLFATKHVRVLHESLIDPRTTFDYDTSTGQWIALRQGSEADHNPQDYIVEQISIQARDGIRVPCTLAYRHDARRDGSAKILLEVYGSYGQAYAPFFSSFRLPFLERGFIVAIAHVRGGGELGAEWHRCGMLEARPNSFNDLIDIADGLIELNYSRPGGIALLGTSAGGQVVGAALNLRPDIWGAAVVHDAFVDVLNSLLDTTLPLTPIEWLEWGNPAEDPVMFECILRYCPYQNITRQPYPPIAVYASLNDRRVPYWESLKWAAKLMATKLDKHPVLVKMNMTGGHGAILPYRERVREYAEQQFFILNALGLDTTERRKEFS